MEAAELLESRLHDSASPAMCCVSYPGFGWPGGGGSCSQPFADEYVQPQGTYSVCIQPSGLGSQHFGAFGSGAGGAGSARATPLPPDSTAAAMPATIIGFIFIMRFF
jgi:hypothetical protein